MRCHNCYITVNWNSALALYDHIGCMSMRIHTCVNMYGRLKHNNNVIFRNVTYLTKRKAQRHKWNTPEAVSRAFDRSGFVCDSSARGSGPLTLQFLREVSTYGGFRSESGQRCHWTVQKLQPFNICHCPYTYEPHYMLFSPPPEHNHGHVWHCSATPV